MTETVKTYADFMLPPSVVSRVDVSRLVREVEMIDNEVTAAAVRAKTGTDAVYHPTLSEQLADFLRVNSLTIDVNGQQRANLITQLRLLKDKAPAIHMTFAVEADRDSLRQLAEWVRQSVHPQAVIAVGLQPGLVAGVYVRTPNRVHDLSLRSALANSRNVLAKEIGALRGTR